MKGKIQILLMLVCAAFGFAFTARAQGEETEAARNSNLVGAALPSNAQRVLPGSVPPEVNQTLDKIVAAGNGKVIRGETEVVIWAGGNYKKSNAPQIARQLQANWKNAGWVFELGGEEDGIALFTLLKDGAARRAVIGFYGGDESAFVLALTELQQPDARNVDSKTDEPVNMEPQRDEPENNSSVRSNVSLRDLAGKWEKKTSGMSSYTTSGSYVGSSGNYESYEISADGRVAYTSLIAVQNYGCRLEAFSQSKGRLSLSGSTMNIALGAGSIRRDDSCSASKNYTRETKPTNMDYKWTLGADDYGVVQLCLTEPNGETFCYRRAK